MNNKVLEYLKKNQKVTFEEERVIVGFGIDDMVEKETVEVRSVSIDCAKNACQMAIDMQWTSVEEKPLEKFIEVLAFNKAWIDEDKCPNGIRIGFLGEDGFISATWNMEQDCYDTVYEEGDDYYKGNAFIIEEEKKKALPNMPTHYMLIPNFKAQKGE